MDLDDPRPRWITVRFEDSPADQPDRLATAFTAEISAWLEPDTEPGRMRVTIAGRDVERDYFDDQALRTGSFSDFVWIFDRETGDVVSATLRGILLRRFDLGLIESEIETSFEALMSTRATAGFARGKHVFGQLVFPLCEIESEDCTFVAASRYDRRTGYVNAVGSILGRAFGMSARSFSALGEAIFAERLSRAAGLADVR